MGLERRGRFHYYYQKSRVDGKVVSTYIGHGALAHFAAWSNETERQQRDIDRCARQEFIAEQRRIDQGIDNHHGTVRQLVAVGLQALGFHQHKRQWRKKRQGEDRKMANEVSEGKRIFDAYNLLLAAACAKKPKKAALDELRQYGIDHPVIFDNYPTLATITLNEVLDASGANEATKIVMKGEVRALQRSLGFETASPMERLMIQNVAICWLRLQFFERTYTAAYSGDGVTLAKADYLEKRLSATQRRYLRAVESLARVRGLLARAGVQINVAQQQVVMNG